MAYSLFDSEFNFSEVLYGKTDADVINEGKKPSTLNSSRRPLTLSADSGSSSDNNDSSNNLFLLKVLDSLLEVCHDGYKIHLATHLPPPSINRAVPCSYPVPPRPPMAYPGPPPRHHQYPVLTPNEHRPLFVPVPLIPTPQMMSIPPPPIRYYHS